MARLQLPVQNKLETATEKFYVVQELRDAFGFKPHVYIGVWGLCNVVIDRRRLATLLEPRG